MKPNTKNIVFTKMHGAGNDFIIIDNRNNFFEEEYLIELAPALCHRRLGIGADGIIALEPVKNPSIDYAMNYRNADGSPAGMCGNGARCLALFASKNGFGAKHRFSVNENVYQAEIRPKNQVKISFPMNVDIKKLRDQKQPIFQLHAGTEHVVIQIPDRKLDDLKWLTEEGRRLRNDQRFNPPGTNVNFICGESENTLRIQTYEKGVEALTLACGTGAIVSSLAWHAIQRKADSEHNVYIVQAPGGTLQVDFIYDQEEQKYGDISLTGEVRFVYKGTYAVPKIQRKND